MNLPKLEDGQIIVREYDSYYAAVRIEGEWLGKDEREVDRHWFVDEWAIGKLASGWVIWTPGKD